MINLRLIYLQAQNNKNSLVNLKNILLLLFHLKYKLIFQVHLSLHLLLESKLYLRSSG